MKYLLMVLVSLFVLAIYFCDTTQAESSDYEVIRKSAEQGNAPEQSNLGVMYANGEGVPEDDAEAVKWFRKAAEQGHAEAQFNLGLMYAKGEGAPEDYVEAYVWANIAAAQGQEKGAELRDILKGKLDNASVAKAQERSKEYFEKYVAPFQ